MLLDIPSMVAAERQKSDTNARTLIEAFESMAAKRGIAHRQIVESCATSQLAAIVTEHARMHDITMVPIGKQADLQQYIAEDVLFGSGRPMIVYPEVINGGRSLSFDVVGIAWDFSRPAARAVADALPLLQRVRTVRVVTVTHDKTIETRRSGAELAETSRLSRGRGAPGGGGRRRPPDRLGTRGVCRHPPSRPAPDGSLRPLARTRLHSGRRDESHRRRSAAAGAALALNSRRSHPLVAGLFGDHVCRLPSPASPRLPPRSRSTASAARSRRSPVVRILSRLRRPIWLNDSISTEKPMAA